jgi:hypothetical protein
MPARGVERLLCRRPGLEEGWIALQGLFERCDGLLVPPQGVEGHTEVAPGLRVVRLAIESFA